MKNYAEELVYWYLRFNGFFPLTNFVLHRQDLTSNQNADADLLGVRPKFVREEVGRGHVDKALFNSDNLNLAKNIGIICEVKSGMQRHPRIPLDQEDRILYALKRIGFFAGEKLRIHAQTLKSNKVARGDFHEVGKLFISEREEDLPGFICITLGHVERFILERIDQFSDEKEGSRHFFDSDMLQYMIWKQGQGRR
ncbi:hypothetical protein GE107_16335 [Cohnella sp. CFH 77786]|uniref:hypothetical protein n=1 Tax=Cohnella sp. CFH 77786 TaxID=2662265 RepID=UPI001C60847B|nr:hypothetical protein [Cohnella sp. CFH 77786]MBW5447627.1 hypothetical protein [Cohnella sp. CFH 77786]